MPLFLLTRAFFFDIIHMYNYCVMNFTGENCDMMKFSLDYIEHRYGVYAGKKVLFSINCLVFFVVMLTAVNNLGIGPFSMVSNLAKAVEAVFGIRTFEDIISDSTIGVLDSTVSSFTMYNTIFMLLFVVIPIMFFASVISVAMRVIKVKKAGKKPSSTYRGSYIVSESNLQIARHFVLMLVFCCLIVCMFLPLFTEPEMFFGDDGLGIAEFLTIGAIRADYSAGYYDFQTSMILSMLFSMLSVAFLYAVSSCITVSICAITSSLEGTLGRDARQTMAINIILVVAARFASEYITGFFIEPAVILHFNLCSYAVIVLSVIGIILSFIPLGRKLDSER